MNPLKLTFTANEQTLTKTDNFTDFASNTVSYIEATFTLGENWTGYDSVRAVWKTDYYTISTVLDANFTCIVPTEVLRYKAKVFVNLVGSIVENDTLTDRLTTFPVLALTVKANAAVNGSETAPVTPSQFEQYVNTVRDEAESISDYSYDSEAWAVGTRGGVDVPSTDPTYHNNSKYWAEENAGLADDVAELADDVADLKSDLSANILLNNTGLSFIGFVPFAVGGFYNGNYTPNLKYRVASKSPLSFDEYTIINAKDGYQFRIISGQQGSYEPITGWITSYLFAPTDSYNICICRNPSDSSEVLTSTTEFVEAITYMLPFTSSIKSNKQNIDKIVVGKITPNWGWQRGIITGSATFSKNNTFRVSTPSAITLSKTTTIEIADGFKMNAVYVGGGGIDWKTDKIMIPANQPFMSMIRRVSENDSEIITDISEFVNALSIPIIEATETNSIIRNNSDVPLLIKQALRPINTVGNQYLTEPKPLVLFHFSDIHGDQSALERLVEFYEYNKDLFDDAICTGDLKAAYSDNSLSFWNNVSGANNILFSIGNHDATNRDSTMQSESDQYTAMFAPYISGWDVTYTTGKTYYYKDYDNSKVRMIVLNNMLTDEENTAQLSWFDTVLAGAKELDYTVLVVTHYPNGWGDGSALECNFTDSDVTRYGAQFLRGTYQAKLRDFRTNGGKFACYLGGHVHVDVMKTNEDIPNQLGVMVDTCSIQQGMPSSDIYRDATDRTADLANVFVLDTSSNTVKVIRVGANRNRYLVSRKTISINYNTLDIISQN